MTKLAAFSSPFVTAAIVAIVLGAPRPAFSQDAALVKKGAAVYTTQKCATCHSIAGKGAKTSKLDGVGTKLTADDIRAWIVDPKAAATKANSTKKPPMQNKYSKLAAADLDALVAYMQSLK